MLIISFLYNVQLFFGKYSSTPLVLEDHRSLFMKKAPILLVNRTIGPLFAKNGVDFLEFLANKGSCVRESLLNGGFLGFNGSRVLFVGSPSDSFLPDKRGEWPMVTVNKHSIGLGFLGRV